MAYESRELIAIQAGSLANRVCAHFWNLQEAQLINQSAQHSFESPFIKNALFDTTCEPNRMRPRLLALDVKQSVNFGLDFNLENDSLEDVYPRWDGSVNTIVRTSSHAHNSNPTTNQSLENWLNCLSTPMSKCWKEDGILLSLPVSMEPLPSQIATSSTISDQNTALSSFIQGEEFMNPGGFAFDQFEERIRQFAERCSRPSGFPLVVNAEDGFGGLGSKMIEYLSEEYSKRPIFCIPVYNKDVVSQMSTRHQLLAQSNQLALINILESSNSFSTHLAWLPVDISATKSKMNACAIAGILAASLDTITTPVRLTSYNGGFPLDDIVSLASQGNIAKMFSMRSGMTPDYPETLTWYTWNPYVHMYRPNVTNNRISNSSLLRRILCRGLSSPQSSLILEYASEEMNSDYAQNPLFTNLELPSMNSGSSVRLISNLPDYPLRTIIPTRNFPVVPLCQQLPKIRMAAILDCPASTSMEMLGLCALVDHLLVHCHRPPDLKMEQDMWTELLEFGRARFMESCNYIDIKQS